MSAVIILFRASPHNKSVVYEIGGACSTKQFTLKSRREEHLEVIGGEARIILEWISAKGGGGGICGQASSGSG
jgi:hypothetical protein